MKTNPIFIENSLASDRRGWNSMISMASFLLVTLLFSNVAEARMLKRISSGSIDSPEAKLIMQTKRSRKRVNRSKPNKSLKPASRSKSSISSKQANRSKPNISSKLVTNGTREQGLLVEKMNGEVVEGEHTNDLFHPASTIKLATALFALRKFGPKYSFTTSISSNGYVDSSTATLEGDLYIAGSDPSLRNEHAIEIARLLNAKGIRKVNGRLVISSQFTFESQYSPNKSGLMLRSALDAHRRSCLASEAYKQSSGLLSDSYSVQVTGGVTVGESPNNALLLARHQSPPLTSILKAMLCFSDNFMAETLGAIMGGAGSLNDFLEREIEIPSAQVNVQSTSGLGTVAMTPRAAMLMLRALLTELEKHKLQLQDILPVAGVDEGTLEHRFTEPTRPGSVVAKTGTHIRTQGGISALVGQMNTVRGPLLFVIFNRRGNVPKFREKQNEIVEAIQDRFGGPEQLPYKKQNFAVAMRLGPCTATRG